MIGTRGSDPARAQGALPRVYTQRLPLCSSGNRYHRQGGLADPWSPLHPWPTGEVLLLSGMERGQRERTDSSFHWLSQTVTRNSKGHSSLLFLPSVFEHFDPLNNHFLWTLYTSLPFNCFSFIAKLHRSLYTLCLHLLIFPLPLESLQSHCSPDSSRETTLIKLTDDSRWQFLSPFAEPLHSTVLFDPPPYWNTFFTWFPRHYMHLPATYQTFLHYHSNPSPALISDLSDSFLTTSLDSTFWPPQTILYTADG